MSSNLNLCAASKITGWCEKCQIHLDMDDVCEELQDMFDHTDPDSGDFMDE